MRLVYAPPLGVGNFGGEVDNWSWPRHTGDFSLLRAYKDGQPYRPRYFFPVSTEGVREGDAVAVLGYPGRSYRSWIADEMKEREERWFPARPRPLRRVDRDPGRGGGALARGGDRRRSTTGAGSRTRARTPRARSRACAAGGSWRSSGRPTSACAPGRRSGRTASAALEAHAGPGEAERGAAAHLGPRLPARHGLARARAACAGRSRSRAAPRRAQKPDAEREPGYMERDLPRMRDQLERDQKRYAEAGGPAAVPLVGEARPGAARRTSASRAVDAAFAGAADDAALDAKIAQLYAGLAGLRPRGRARRCSTRRPTR